MIFDNAAELTGVLNQLAAEGHPVSGEEVSLDERRQAIDRWHEARLAYAGAKLGHALEVARFEHRPSVDN